MNGPELSRGGGRHLGWTSCLITAGRVTLAGINFAKPTAMEGPKKLNEREKSAHLIIQ